MFLRFLEQLKSARAALMFAAGLAFSAPSQAIIIVGAWDPAFGSAFPELGWRGEAKFFVPDACLAESAGVQLRELLRRHDEGAQCKCRVLQALRPSNPLFQETLSFDDPTSLVAAMKIEDGLLAGLYATFDYFVPSLLGLPADHTQSSCCCSRTT